jgi:cytochrome c-type biogenesis protein CcmE
MDPRRKRTIRLTIALSVAVLLGGALIYTSFSGATETRQPSELLAGATPGKSARGSVKRGSNELLFRVRDRGGTATVPVRYAGAVPDPFREGREVILKGKMDNGLFVGERDSLITKCPSKFSKQEQS